MGDPAHSDQFGDHSHDYSPALFLPNGIVEEYEDGL